MSERGVITEQSTILPVRLLRGRFSQLAAKNLFTACGSLPTHFVVAGQENLSHRRHHQDHSKRRAIEAPQAAVVCGESELRRKLDGGKCNPTSGTFGVNFSYCLRQRAI